MKRIGSAMLATVVGAAAVVLATSQPALAAASVNLPLSSWAYLDSQSPKTKFVNPAVAPPVGTILDDANKAHTYRSYFTYDLTQLKGAVVHNSYLYTYEETVTDCSTAATIELWRTAPVKTGTTWSNPPAELEKLISVNRGQGAYYCPSYLGIDMVSTLNAALARHEKSITIEYRITAAQEADPRAGRTFQQPTLSSTSNHPPTVTELRLESPTRPCGTVTKPSPAAATTLFRATANDPDEGDSPSILYAIWPVDHPDQRREFNSYNYGTDLNQYADGELLAWQAQASDHYDVGPWSKLCYLVMDKTAPANPPAVASKRYPEGTTPGGGTGLKGKFRLDAGGDLDVVAFRWRDSTGYSGQVKAREPGGTAVLEYTPKRGWFEELTISSVDAVGNQGPERRYSFNVAETAPSVQIEMGGVGLASTLAFTARKPETTAFGYQIKGGPETRVPAVDGGATGQLTFTETGEVEVVVSSYVKNKLIGQDTLRTYVTDAPGVESAEFNFDTDQIAGKTGSFTFTPRNRDVVAYEYVLDGVAQTVQAAADDTAVVPWTATAGWHDMVVRSVRADGEKSMETYHQFNVIDPVPHLYSETLQHLNRIDGVGLPVEFYVSSRLPDVTGFVYRFDGGPEVAIDGGGGSTEFAVTPVHTGDNTLVVQALLADGTRSPEKTFTWQPFEAPVVTTDPANGGAGGQPMTLTFRSVLPDTKEFRYSLDFGEYQSVTARPDGTATVSFTPQSGSGWFSARVTGVAQDGTTSPERDMTVPVRDTRVSVWSEFSDWSPRGGIGVPGDFSFSTSWTPEVVEYRYRLNDGPELTVPMGDSWNTLVTVVPDRNGLNMLTVQGRTEDGRLSPITEYPFQVGTAPYVFSEEYPQSTPGGGVGIEGRFEFSGGTAGITSFEYTIGGVPGTVEANAEGRASITWTPTEAIGTYLVVKGRKADGSTTDEVWYFVVVQSD
ncbi:hypothetical protein [Micromonospora chokoriensis]|uniref:hypothetical protein n=1 Tax=Micromonospora chokoriensis TaxID=356851 RepID=UPI0004C4548E|nr:hypothetical protein [Micromonospora chokoriensis]